MNRPRHRWHVLHSVQPRRQSWGYSINQLTGRATFYFRVSKAGNKLALTVVSCCSCTVTVARPTATFGTKTPVASRVVWTHQQVRRWRLRAVASARAGAFEVEGGGA